MPADARRTTGIVLLAASTVAGAVSLFPPWGQLAGRAFGGPWFVLSNVGLFFGTDATDNQYANNPLIGVGAILLAVTLLALVIALVAAIAASPRAFVISSIADVLGLVAVGTYVFGLYAYTERGGDPSFPLEIGFWLAVGMLVLAFIAPFLLRSPAAPPVPPPVVGTPRVMRVTGPPAPPKRLKCPKCGNLEHVTPGTKPVCTKCGYGAPPGGAPAATAEPAPEAAADAPHG